MYILARSSSPEDPIPHFEKSMQKGMDMLCQRLWQPASVQVRARYPRFALEPRAFNQKVCAYEDWEYLSMNDVVNMLHAVLPIKEFYEGRHGTRDAGMVLRQASLAGCMLGAEASIGDMETAILHLQVYPEAYDDLTPNEIYARFMAGECQPFRYYLNGMLGESSERLRRLKRPSNHPNPEKRIYWYDGEEDTFTLDHEVMRTHYHLFSSLVGLTEPVVGHA